MKNLDQNKYIGKALVVFLISFLCLNAYASDKDIVGKWYDQNDPKSTLELFEDKDLIATGKDMDSTGTWIQLSDGRLKLKINSVFGTVMKHKKEIQNMYGTPPIKIAFRELLHFTLPQVKKICSL